jgi:hypothetical protein
MELCSKRKYPRRRLHRAHFLSGKDRKGVSFMKKNGFFDAGTFRVLAGTAALGLAFSVALAACGGKKGSGGSGGNAPAGGAAAAAEAVEEAVTRVVETPASDFNYDLSKDGKGVVINKYTGDGGAVVIPAEIEGLPVVEITTGDVFKGGVFKGEDRDGVMGPGYNRESVVIPAGVKSLDYATFSRCENLTSVTFLGTGVALGEKCFAGCINLSALQFPEGGQALKLGKYGDDAFRGCTKLPLAVRAQLKEWGFTEI